MGSHTSVFKGDKEWAEPQINSKVDEVFSKYATLGQGLDRNGFGNWLQAEATSINKQYKEEELNEEFTKVQKDMNGRIQKNNLADYLRKVHP